MKMEDFHTHAWFSAELRKGKRADYIMHEYQDLFFNLVTSKSDNATFNKEYASRQIVKIPDIDFQDASVKKIDSIESIISKLREIEKEIDDQLEYAIV